jgi:uncharacterized protein YdeI (YjbR/CyaY-like superfamily)
MNAPELKDGQATIYAPDQAAWRQWLQENHATQEFVWLILYRKGSGTPSVYYPEAVDEALCFGWIDSKPNKRDANSYYQFFSRRKPKSVWSKVNKTKVERLLAAGKIAPAGQRMIAIAQENGMWTHLDAIEEEVMPDDLVAAFAEQPDAFAKFQGFPPSARKAIFQWIIGTKVAETRAKRVAEAVAKAALGERANAWKGRKS